MLNLAGLKWRTLSFFEGTARRTFVSRFTSNTKLNVRLCQLYSFFSACFSRQSRASLQKVILVAPKKQQKK